MMWLEKGRAIVRKVRIPLLFGRNNSKDVWVLTIRPAGVLTFRAYRCAQEYDVTLESVLRLALQQAAAAEKREKAEARKARRKGRAA